jgi:hypothetical protein
MFKEFISSLIKSTIDIKVEHIIEEIEKQIHSSCEKFINRLKKRLIFETFIILALLMLIWYSGVVAKKPALGIWFASLLTWFLVVLVVLRIFFGIYWLIKNSKIVKVYTKLWFYSKMKQQNIQPRLKRFCFMVCENEYEKRMGNWKHVHSMLIVLNFTPEKKHHYQKIYSEIRIMSKNSIMYYALSFLGLVILFVIIRYFSYKFLPGTNYVNLLSSLFQYF